MNTNGFRLAAITNGVSRYCSVLFLLGLTVSHSVFGAPRDVASRAFPSVAMIVTEDRRGQPLAIGSGFFVKENVLASNAHVIENAVGGYIKLVGQKAKHEIKGIVAIDSKHDLVLLAVDGVSAPMLRLGDFATVAIGDSVYSVGSPQGLEGTFASGVVSAMREFDGDKLLQLTAPISPGSSGGPILNDEGKVIGAAVATFKNGQNLNFAIPVTHLSSLIATIGSPKPLSDYRQTKNESAFKDAGENSRKGITIGSFIWSGSSLQFVIRNNLRTPVTNIKALMIFYDSDAEACDFKEITFPKYAPLTSDRLVIPTVEEMRKGVRITTEAVKTPVGETTIPAGLAKPDSVQVDPATKLRASKTAPEVRILGFDIVESTE